MPFTQTKMDLKRFKEFKTILKCNIQNWRQNQYFTSKKSRKPQNVGLNLLSPRKSQGKYTVDFDIFGKLMHKCNFLYPLLSTYLQLSGPQ